MPPKKAKAAATPRKSKAAPKTPKAPKAPPKAASKKKVAPPSKSTKRKRVPAPSPEPVPIWDQNITSQGQREKKRFKLTMSSNHEDINEEHIANLAKSLIGESRNTWGISEPVVFKAVVGKKSRMRAAPSAFQATEDRWMSMMADMQNMQPVRMANIPNSPERSPILRIALEPREVIYSYLLIYPKPIIVKHDWEIVERNPFVDHSIILVCKQFATEASAFLYRNNTFQALLRVTTGQFRRFEVPTTIAPSHHANFRNLIINCSPDCWNMDWHEKTAKGLMTLVSAKAVIKSLTLVVSPKRVGMSTTALGDENTPITFADFLWYHGPLMTAIRRLAPQVLKIIVTKSGTNRFGMEVNTSYVQAGLLEEGPLANEETVRMRKLNVQSVEGELMTLKMRLEQIYEDDQLAALEGVCTPLIDEKVANRATPPTTVPSHGRRK